MYQIEALTQVFSFEIYEIFKNTCFEKHLRTTASAFISFSFFYASVIKRNHIASPKVKTHFP